MTTRELTKCMQDPWWRLNNLYYIMNKAGDVVKFRPNRVQQYLYANLWYMNLVLKARQMGITTYFILSMLDRCLFNKSQQCGVIAHRREDAEKFFIEKVQFAYDRLPEFVLNELPATKNEAGWLRLKNDSSMRVSVGMRSSTLQQLHVSEFGKVCAEHPDKAKEIIKGSMNAVEQGNIVNFESTAEGPQGAFHDYCMAALAMQREKRTLTSMDWKLFFFPWFEQDEYRMTDEDVKNVVITPEYEQYFELLAGEKHIELTLNQKVWYVKKAGLMGAWDDMKSEFPSYPEEAFSVSVKGSYYSTQFARIHKEQRITKVPHQSGVPVDLWWDIGVGDSTVIWFTQSVRGVIHVIDYYENNGEGLSHYASKLQERRQNEGYLYGRIVGPHDMSVREFSTGKSRIEAAAAMGLNFEIAPRLSLEDGIEAVRNILSVCYFDEKKCDKGLKALKNYRKKFDEKEQRYLDRPAHNWASHPSDAFRMLAVAHTFQSSKSVRFSQPTITPAAWG